MVDRGMHSEVVRVTATGAQTMGRFYASVVAQTEDTGDEIDAGGALGPSRGGSEELDPAAAMATKLAATHLVRAFVVHGVLSM